MKNSKKTNWESEFAEFLISEPVEVPHKVTETIISKIQKELNPSFLQVFGKISSIHLIVGLVTLMFCPQFDISITSQVGLVPYLMQFGHEVCTFGCGAIFVGTSLLASSFYLKPEEVKVLKRHELLQLLVLSSLSLGFFVALGAEVVLSLGIIWLAGATLGGILSLNLGWTLRRLQYREAL